MKTTDYENWDLGVMTQDQTWWGKKIMEHAAAVRSGAYGEVLKEWTQSDGWGDGVVVPHFLVYYSTSPVRGALKFKSSYVRVIKATESGVFEQLECGWGRLQELR